MMTECSKKIIEQIYSNQDSINTVRDIVDIWNNKDELLGQVIQDKIRGIELQFKDHDYGKTIYKKINEDVYIGFHPRSFIWFYSFT